MRKFSTKQILLSALMISIIGSLLHFVYDWMGQWPPVGLIAAVNESVWEHTKLAYVPMTVFWVVIALRRPRERAALLAGGAAGTVTTLLLIPMLYYFCIHGLGIESLALDIALFFVNVLIGQLVGAHVARYTKSPFAGLLGAVVFVLLIVMYSIFTFAPPQLPIFAVA